MSESDIGLIHDIDTRDAEAAIATTRTALPYTRFAVAFADGVDDSLAAMYDETRAAMLTEYQALQMLITRSAEAFASQRGSDAYERRQAALHYASIVYGEYTLEEADFAFGRGAR